MPAPSRLPVKLHRRVSLIQTEDAILAKELLAQATVARDILGKLTDRVLLIRPGRVEAVVAALQDMNHTPRVIGR